MPIYRIVVYEDYVTRETVFINRYDQEMLRLPAENGYDPFLWAKTQFKLSSDSELGDLQRIIYDPAHTAVEVTLLPELFYASYLKIEQEEQAMLEASMARDSPVHVDARRCDESSNGNQQLEQWNGGD